jgi:hypothetical protein
MNVKIVEGKEAKWITRDICGSAELHSLSFFETIRLIHSRVSHDESKENMPFHTESIT